ncbi:hypothetical protein ABPG74_021396 [Tetrahymena malaccensis]
MLKNSQKQNKDLSNKQIKKNIAFYQDNVEEKAYQGVDFIQDSQKKLTNIRYSGELDDPLPINAINNAKFQKDNAKIKNMQNFTNDEQFSQRKYSQNFMQQQENIKNNINKLNFNNKTHRQSLSPQNQLQDKDYHRLFEIDQKELFDELDEWKNELDNIKRVQNYNEQILGIKGSTYNSLQQEGTNNKQQRQFKLLQISHLNGKQPRSEYENYQNSSINQQTNRQLISMSNDIQFSQIDSTRINASNIQQKMHSNVQGSIINQEPQINETILNSIVNNYDFNSSAQNKQIQINHSDSIDEKQKHLLSNGASPQMKRKIKKKYYEPENDVSSNQLTSQQKTSSLQNQDSETQDSKSVIKYIAQPKKTIKQIQSETNEMLIEKLFLLKLKKKIEPLHQEHIEDLKHRFLSKFKEQNSLQDNPNRQKQNQFLSRYPSPKGNEERQNSGFISERSSRPQSITSQFFQKQQEIVKDEIENFQKKTLDSFKFIQQIKRAKSGTPQLLNLVSGKKVGGNQNQTKTEQYIQQLEKEFTLNSVKQSAQLTKNLENTSVDSTFVNEQVQQQLLLNYKQTISNIKEKKDILESSRLETFRLQSIINQILEEKKDLQQKMQAELEKAALQKYQVFSRQNIITEKEQDSQQEAQLKIARNKEQKHQKSFANLNSQIQEQQKNIQIDFDRRQRSLSSKIRQLQQLLKENQFNSNSLQEELSTLKNSKLTKKKQLKNYYLSLLQQHKSYENPQISIIKLIEYMQEIDEEIEEKMLPNYFDQDNIEFVKKLQRLSIQLEKLQEEFQIVSKSTKNSLHSQIQLNKIQQSQQEFISSPILKSSLNLAQPKKSFIDQQSQIELKMNNQIVKNLAQSSSPALSQSLISQNLVSNRNWEDEDKKLLQMMIGKEVNHKKEIKKKLSKISKNTLQTKNQNLEYYQLYSQNYIVQEEEDEQNKDSSSLISQDRVKENILNEREPRYSKALKFTNRQKEDDEYYFFLYNLKRGSLSILEYNKKLSEQIHNTQINIDKLKEQELERLIKKYNNVTAEDRLLNVKKIFILMYGFQEGNDWYSKFIKKRKEILMKSVASKTFNFQEYIYSKNNQQKIDFILNQKENPSKQEKNQAQQDLQKIQLESTKEADKFISNRPLQINQQKEYILNKFKILQETPNSIGGTNAANHLQFQDPFQLFIKRANFEQISTTKANPREYKTQKQRKSVHFSNQNVNQQEQNEINQLSNTTLNFSSKNL